MRFESSKNPFNIRKKNPRLSNFCVYCVLPGYVVRLPNHTTIFYPIFGRNKVPFFKKWVSTLLHPPLQMQHPNLMKIRKSACFLYVLNYVSELHVKITTYTSKMWWSGKSTVPQLANCTLKSLTSNVITCRAVV